MCLYERYKRKLKSTFAINYFRKLIISVIISITLAIYSFEYKQDNRQIVPVVFKIDSLPDYEIRKRPLKNHFQTDFSVRPV